LLNLLLKPLRMQKTKLS